MFEGSILKNFIASLYKRIWGLEMSMQELQKTILQQNVEYVELEDVVVELQIEYQNYVNFYEEQRHSMQRDIACLKWATGPIYKPKTIEVQR